VNRDVEIAAGGLQRAAGRVPAGGGVLRVDTRCVARAIDRATLERGEIGLETGRAGVGEIVVVDGLRAEGFLRAGHRHVEHAVHNLSTLLVLA
jgi:hypothetical protein